MGYKKINTLYWFKCYLNNQKQFVSYSEENTSLETIKWESATRVNTRTSSLLDFCEQSTICAKYA